MRERLNYYNHMLTISSNFHSIFFSYSLVLLAKSNDTPLYSLLVFVCWCSHLMLSHNLSIFGVSPSSLLFSVVL